MQKYAGMQHPPGELGISSPVVSVCRIELQQRVNEAAECTKNELLETCAGCMHFLEVKPGFYWIYIRIIQVPANVF